MGTFSLLLVVGPLRVFRCYLQLEHPFYGPLSHLLTHDAVTLVELSKEYDPEAAFQMVRM